MPDTTNILVIPRWNDRFQCGSYSNYYPMCANYRRVHDMKEHPITINTAVSDWLWGSEYWTSASTGRAMNTFRLELPLKEFRGWSCGKRRDCCCCWLWLKHCTRRSCLCI